MAVARGTGRSGIPRGARILVGAVAILLCAGATACAPEPGPPPTTATPSPTPTPDPTTPAPTPEPTEEPWERFSDPRFPQSFEVPPDWEVREIPSEYAAEDQYQLEVLDAAGAVRLHLLTGVQGLGGACTDALPVLTIEELDSEALELPGYAPPADAAPVESVPPRFVFRAAQLADRVVTSLSVSDDAPAPSCMYYNLLRVQEGPMAFADAVQVDGSEANPAPPRTFASMDEARAFMGTEEYTTLKRVLLSLRLAP
ncbi:hypothetical protein [Leucobacter sp.]